MVFKKGFVLLALFMVYFPTILFSKKTDLSPGDDTKESRRSRITRRYVEEVQRLDDLVWRMVYSMKRDIYQQCNGNPALIGPMMAAYYRDLWDVISAMLEGDEPDSLE